MKQADSDKETIKDKVNGDSKYIIAAQVFADKLILAKSQTG